MIEVGIGNSQITGSSRATILQDQTGDVIDVVTLTVIQLIVIGNVQTVRTHLDLGDGIYVSALQGNDRTGSVITSDEQFLCLTEDLTLCLGVSNEDRQQQFDRAGRGYNLTQGDDDLTTVVLGDIDSRGGQHTTFQTVGVGGISNVLRDADRSQCFVADEGLVIATSVQGDCLGTTVNVGDELTEDLVTDTGLFLVGFQSRNNRLRKLEDQTIRRLTLGAQTDTLNDLTGYSVRDRSGEIDDCLRTQRTITNRFGSKLNHLGDGTTSVIGEGNDVTFDQLISRVT